MKTSRLIAMGVLACTLLLIPGFVSAQKESSEKQNAREQEQKQKLEAQKAEMEVQKKEMEVHKKEMEVHKKEMELQKERIEAQRIAFITNELELTPAEAQSFWPVYNEYDTKRRELQKKFRSRGDDDMRLEEMSDKEAMEMADNQLIEAQKLLDLRKEYHSKFKSILSPKKILKLYGSEREFQRHLIDRIRDKKSPGKGGKASGRAPRQGGR